LEFRRWAADAKFGLAVVTSNHADLIGAALEATGQIEHLPLTRLYSSYSSLNPPQLKPHPAVYRLALQDTGANAKKTVAIEDAPSGAMSSSGAEIFTFGLTQHIPKSVQATEERRLLDAGAQQLISNWQSMISAVKNHFFIP
jgi:beta-phosphoglucomutase-like phosphatase (HAD superfamily)